MNPIPNKRLNLFSFLKFFDKRGNLRSYCAKIFALSSSNECRRRRRRSTNHIYYCIINRSPSWNAQTWNINCNNRRDKRGMKV